MSCSHVNCWSSRLEETLSSSSPSNKCKCIDSNELGKGKSVQTGPFMHQQCMLSYNLLHIAVLKACMGHRSRQWARPPRSGRTVQWRSSTAISWSTGATSARTLQIPTAGRRPATRTRPGCSPWPSMNGSSWRQAVWCRASGTPPSPSMIPCCSLVINHIPLRVGHTS